jgi:hypothetical protein
MGLKKILPELATSIGVQSARAGAQQMTSLPANIAPPVRAYEFNEANLNPTSVSDTTFVLITTHLVPPGAISVATELAVTAESSGALGDVEVQVQVGGVPVPRYDSLNCPDFGTFDQPARTNIKAIEGQRIQVFARARTVGATHAVRAMLRGWDSIPSLMTNLDSIYGWRGQ